LENAGKLPFRKLGFPPGLFPLPPGLEVLGAGTWCLTSSRNDSSGQANVVLRDCVVLPPQLDHTCAVVAQRRVHLK